jgi:hypothetical protein
VRNRYVDEMAELRPGALLVVEPADLPAEVATARDEPFRTWHGLDPVPFGRADAARAYLRWWAGVLR